jgi:UDP-N-acetyl-D-mannosaminuronic acid dehydrogenase
VPILRRSGLSIAGDAPSHRGTEAGAPGPTAGAPAPLFVAHCPERVLPGRILEELVCNDRVIGGVDRASAERARALYASFVEGELFLTDATTAEMVKLMENTYRDVNIALANELALVAEQVGIDVWQAIALANHHPRVHVLQPGPGVGGHCIAVDPWFIVQAAPAATPLIQTARRVNAGRPAHVVELVERAVAGIHHPTIACLGLAYKADVDDVRESPAVEVVRQLTAGGYHLRVFDPHVERANGVSGQASSLTEAINGADCLLVLTDHRRFRELVPDALAPLVRTRLVVDTRHCLPHAEWRAAGFTVVSS